MTMAELVTCDITCELVIIREIGEAMRSICLVRASGHGHTHGLWMLLIHSFCDVATIILQHTGLQKSLSKAHPLPHKRYLAV